MYVYHWLPLLTFYIRSLPIGQGCVKHGPVSAASVNSQACPPSLGGGLSHSRVRLRVPPPQVTVHSAHVNHEPQPPSEKIRKHIERGQWNLDHRHKSKYNFTSHITTLFLHNKSFPFETPLICNFNMQSVETKYLCCIHKNHNFLSWEFWSWNKRESNCSQGNRFYVYVHMFVGYFPCYYLQWLEFVLFLKWFSLYFSRLPYTE